MKKIIFYSLIVLISIGSFGAKTFAQTTPKCVSPAILVNGTCVVPTGTCTLPSGEKKTGWQKSNCVDDNKGTWVGDYYFLAPLPCTDSKDPNCTTNPNGENQTQTSFDPSDTNALGKYLNLMIKIIIGISAVLAVVMIVIGGMEYMTSELISSKEAGKERIEHALLGLLIALGSYALLNTINPALLDSSLTSLTDVKVDVNVANADIAQTPKTVNGVQVYSTGGKDYPAGSNFAADFPQLHFNPDLPDGVKVKGSQCVNVGDKNCTSILGLDTSIVNKMEKDCTSHNSGTPCEILITGGTEFWAHNSNTGHKPGSADVDISATDAMNKYITGNNAFPKDAKIIPSNGVCYYPEGVGATSATTAKHWHVYPMTGGHC